MKFLVLPFYVGILIPAVDRLNKQKATIVSLQYELETAEDAISQKDSEISDLKDSILLKREEVKNNAN